MTSNYTLVQTAGGGRLQNIKDAADLAKKVGDIELCRKIVHLEGEVIELTREK